MARGEEGGEGVEPEDKKNRRRGKGKGKDKDKDKKVVEKTKGKGKSSTKRPRRVYEPFDARFQQDLKAGALLKGRLRVNPRRREEAYVTVEGVEVDVILKGRKNQNRTVDGDEVAIRILPLEDWDSAERLEDAVEDSDESEEEGVQEDDSGLESLTELVEKKLVVGDGGGGDQARAWTLDEINNQIREHKRRPAGKVVGIVNPTDQRKHIVCRIHKAEKLEDLSPATSVTFRPVEDRFPFLRLQVPTDSKKEMKRLKKLELTKARDKFILVMVTKWPLYSEAPFCGVVEVLGEMTSKENQISAVLLQQGIEQTHLGEFSKEVISCLPSTPWEIGDKEISLRRDLRSWRIFSIDPETARDLDDALSIEMVDEKTARVGVHIADVTHFVRPATSLDKEASKRATSVYMVDGVLPMLPRLLCEELCSLNPGTDRLAFSIVWEISLETCDVLSEWIGKTVIRSCTKLNYGQAQEIIEGKALSSAPKVHQHTVKEISGDVKLLDKIAKRLRAQRFERGALTLNIPRVSIVLGEDMTPIGAKQYVQRDSNYLVEEFMLLANRRVALFISEKVPSAALLRRHPPPHRRKIEGLVKMTDKMNLSIDVSSSGAIHESLERIRSEVDASTFYAVVLLATKPMQTAMYFCTGAPAYQEQSSKWRHYALAFDHYTHFTSPIRRYADVVVHRLLVDILAREGEGKKKTKGSKKGKVFESTGKGGQGPWGAKFTEELIDQCDHCNKQKLAAKAVQDSSIKIYLALWLQKESYETEAVILDLNGPKWMGVFVPEFGMEFVLYWREERRFKARWDSTSKKMNVCALESTKENEPLLRLENFQTVRVSLVSAFDKRSCANEITAKLVI